MPTYTYVPAPKPYWQEFQDFVSLVSPDIFQFSVNTVTSVITCATNPNYYTGLAVTVSTTNTLPSPLSPSVPYYIIVLGSNSYRLANSYENAMTGTYVAITTAGTGVQSITTAGQTYIIPLANGKIYTYSSIDHSINKATYTDWTGSTALPNPIILDNTGKALIYWQVNQDDPTDNYYIEVYNNINVLMYTLDNFNAPSGSGGGRNPGSNILNHCRNAQFTYWDLCDYGNIDPTFNVTTMPSAGAEIGYVELANEWFFTKNNNHANDVVTKEVFSAGATIPPNGSVNYLQFQCLSAGAGGESYKYIYQYFDNVQTFNGKSLIFSVYMKGTASVPIYLDAVQQFGAGGSADVEIPGALVTINTTFANYATQPMSIPSTATKNIQPGSRLLIRINMPLNATFTLSIADASFTETTIVPPYQVLTLEEQKSKLTPFGYYAETGDIRVFPKAILGVNYIPRTWIKLVNTTIGNALSNATGLANPDSKSLFFFLWNNYDNVLCPVYTSAGVKTTRGADAKTDYDANYQIALWTNEGRLIANAGIPQFIFDYTVTDGANGIITIVSDGELGSHNLYTGTKLTVFASGTSAALPTPLAPSPTVYYIISTGIANQYKFADSLAHAVAGTFIPLTTSGTGIQTLQYYQANDEFSSGQFYGETLHTPLISEMANHGHDIPDFQGLNAIVPTGSLQFQSPGGNRSVITDPATSLTGSGQPFNIVQPTLALPYIIKL